MIHFYTRLLPRWYVWLAMDAGCALFGHETFLCWNGRNWRSRLWSWSLQADLPQLDVVVTRAPFGKSGAHTVWDIPVAISHEVRRHVFHR